MIYVLHGENTADSYQKLNQLLIKYPSHTRINQETGSIDDLVNNIATQDLISTKKIIIAQNFISKYKLKPKQLKTIDQTCILVLWEVKELTKSQAASFTKIAQVEIFKLPPVLFHFLDAISGPSQNTIKLLNKINSKDSSLLVWQLLNRLFLLTIAKMDIDDETVSKIVCRVLSPWQWQKIKDQSKNIDITKLKKLYTSTLKIDYLQKTGGTGINPQTLISLMFLKYLPI